MQTVSEAPRVRWQTLVIVALTIALLWLAFRNVDLKHTWDAITHADLRLIGLAILVTFSTYALRAIRWTWLLKPLGAGGFRIAFRMTVIGFATNFLLPGGRVGEVLRPFLLARHERINAASAFATIVVERLLDIVVVLLFFAGAIAVSVVDVGDDVRIAAYIAAGMAVAGFIVLFVLAGHPERLGRLTEKLGRWLPARVAQPLARIVRTFAEGLAVLRSPSNLLMAGLWSVGVWLSIAAGIWVVSHAFDLTISFVGSFLVVGYLTVGVAAPTPGGAGGFHFMYKLALTQFFGADPDVAVAAATVLHAVSFVPVSLMGIVFMWQDGLTLGGLRHMRTEAPAAPTP
jgi:uncharacterized protein (TIRG00374 family)